jgi:hypothetical protein
LLFKRLFVGRLFVRIERKLMREVQCTYRPFLRLKLSEMLSEAPLARIAAALLPRRNLSADFRRDRGGGDEARIRHRRVLHTDAVHLQANAHLNKFEVQRVKPFEYLGKLGQTITEDRAAQGKGEAKPPRASARKKIKVRRVIRRRD